MKKNLPFILLALALPISNGASSQESERSSVIELPILTIPMTSAFIDMPDRNLMPKMNTLFSMGGSFVFYPDRQTPLGIELRGSTGRYAFGKETRTFNFDGADPTVLDITYRSKVNKLLLGVKFVNNASTRLIKPFGSVHAGYAMMRSRIFIPDPNDDDDCAPIENKLIHRFNGLVYGAEVGAEVNLTRSRSDMEEGIFFFVSGSILKSFKTVEYINVDYLSDEAPAPATSTSHQNHSGHQVKGPGNVQDYNAQFINVTSNQLHYHKVAELYRTPLQFVGVNFGLVMRL